MNSVFVSYRTITNNRGIPQIFIDALKLNDGGFQKGTPYDVNYEKNKIVVTFLLALRYIDSVRKFKTFYNKHKDMFFAYL